MGARGDQRRVAEWVGHLPSPHPSYLPGTISFPFPCIIIQAMATIVPQWKERLPVALGRQSTFCTNFRPRVKGSGEELPCAREHLLQVGGGWIWI